MLSLDAHTVLKTGLFAATVAAFIVEGYKQLSPDAGEQTVALLSQLLAASTNTSSHASHMIVPPAPFLTTPSAVITNSLWFSSLLISLFCALLSTLAQQWSRDYVRDINRRRVLHEDPETRVHNHIFIRMGIDRYGMDQLVSWVVALVHLSVFLFAIGLAVFLFPINTAVASIALGVLGTFAMVYSLASLLPLFDRSCPYRTPLTYLMAYAYWLGLHGWFMSQRILTCVLYSALAEGGRIPASSHAYATSIHDITSRHAPDDREVLAPNRTIFLWECTGRHVPDDAFERVVRGLLTLPCGPADQQLHSYLCADKAFAKRLYWHIHRHINGNIDLSLFTVVSLLSGRMFRNEVERPGAVSTRNMTSGYYINVFGLFSRLATFDGPSKLPAQLCLSNIRWSFLMLCLHTSHGVMAAPLSEEQVLACFDNTSSGEFALQGRHPSTLLVLLVLGHYSLALRSWSCRTESVLIPLHADDCCMSWKHPLAPENIAHVAACNALTMISHVLEALSANDERDIALLRNAPNTVMTNLKQQFPMSDYGRKAPSSKFMSVLCAAGLEDWLNPDSDYSTEPQQGPFHQYKYSLYVNDCVSILRTLAKSVDFTACYARFSKLSGYPASSLHYATAIADSYTVASPQCQHSPATSSSTEHSSFGNREKLEDDEVPQNPPACQLS